jgi:2-amino-4-hydroxy-6-hydroxymethyldihydropteridine diphosphokinase
VEKAAIGIGSNQGDSVRICSDVFDLLQKHPAVSIVKASSLYRTKPVGFTGQDWFVNAAVLCETSLEPLALLDFLFELETSFGRVRTIRWGPRTLDLDILFYGNRQLDLPGLKVPHPQLQNRLFVLVPLAEIEPDWVHPGSGLRVQEMLDRLLQLDHQQEIHKLSR